MVQLYKKKKGNKNSMRDAIESHPTFTKLLVYFKKGQAGIQVFFFACFLQALTNGIKMRVIQHLLTL